MLNAILFSLTVVGCNGVSALATATSFLSPDRANEEDTPVKELAQDPVTSSPESEVPDVVEELRAWLYKHFGIVGLVILSLGWWVVSKIRWGWFRQFPGIRSVLARRSLSPLPKSAPNRFTVAIAQLDGDTNEETRTLLAQSLADVSSLDTTLFERAIPLSTGNIRVAVESGHVQAREYLAESGADVLIWGVVLRHDGQSIPKLFWTTSASDGFSIAPDRYPINPDLELPEIFWKDLAQVLHLLVEHGVTRSSSEGKSVDSTELSSYIDKVSSLLRGSTAQGWSAETKTRVKFILANALVTLGERSGEPRHLDEAKTLYRDVLTTWTRESSPMRWADGSARLGKTIVLKAEASAGTTEIEEAVRIFRDVIVVVETTHDANQIGLAKMFLGNGLKSVALGDSTVQRYKEAIAVYREVEQCWQRGRSPDRWASLQLNFGIVLRQLGEFEIVNTLEGADIGLLSYNQKLWIA